jgi:hypothetical protein
MSRFYVLLGLGFALIGSRASGAEQTETCQWLDSHGITVKIRFFKDKDAYLPKSVLAMINTSGKTKWLQALYRGQKTGGYVRVLDSRFDPVTDNDFEIKPVPLQNSAAADNPYAFNFVPFRAGESVTEELDWNRFLLAGKHWQADEQYTVSHVISRDLADAMDAPSEAAPIWSVDNPKRECQLRTVKIRAR